MKNKIKSAFDEVRAEQSLKDNTVEAIRERLYKQPSKYRGFKRFAVAFCCLMLLATGGTFSFFTEVSAISIDSETSSELGINLFGRVISVRNFDGSDLDSLKYKEYTQALDEIVKKVPNDSDICLTVSASSETKSKKIIKVIQKSEECKGKKVSYSSGNNEEKDTADELGISYGKYKAYLTLKNLGSEITIDEIKHLSMKQINVLISSFNNDEVLDSNENSSSSENCDSSSLDNNNSNCSTSDNSSKGNLNKDNSNGQNGKGFGKGRY